ncbi:GDYXXLXY domain-containing protein [Alkalihalobacillus oceani]|uniref:GDYXXLXY domain-containing protein n=1 Tax=Halalkalibacter oceani TaxID=1653776 RepID=A0A9X2DNZ7_9BACI|nr:GDYXXLXY domain-containing protein [Halalkalibacter oceani]MCM3713808.1 GDYXXLXY domain-containing protein [Halalkalibacter oceani]
MDQEQKRLGHSRIIDLAYLFGVSLLVAAVVYFFAANWSALGHGSKISLITLLLLGFYGIAFFFRYRLPWRPFVGKLFLLGGVIAFGVSVALLGQMYNSHADSYLLFLVWLAPAFLFAVLTKLQSFYLLSYMLLHATIGFFLFPSSVAIYRSEGELVAWLVCLALGNALLGLGLEARQSPYRALSYLSYLVSQLIWLVITMRWVFESYTYLLNSLYLLVSIVFLYWLWKKRPNRVLLLLTVGSVAVYVAAKAILWMLEYGSELFFVLILLLAGLTVFAAGFVIKKLRNVYEKQKNQEVRWWQSLIVHAVSTVSAVVATTAFIGLMTMIIQSLLSALYVLLAAALLVTVLIFGKRLEEVWRHTIVHVGVLLTLAFVWDVPTYLALVSVLLLLLLWYKEESVWMDLLLYGATNVVLLFIFWPDRSTEAVMWLMVGLNLLALAGRLLLKEPLLKKRLTVQAMLYSLLFGFVLTFLTTSHPSAYYLYNALFFAVTTYLGFRFVRSNEQVLARTVLVFWFAFLFYKYYDLVWRLLHKSVALFLLGLLLLAVAIMLDRKRKEERDDLSPAHFANQWALVVVICLQLAFIGFQYAQYERQLANGSLIKLELEPLDPRSLLQGDYLTLQFSISHIPELEGKMQRGEKLKLVLSPDDQNVYHYTGIYQQNGAYNQPYTLQEEDVLMNGKATGYDRFSFGIESYFIEEGSGSEAESEAEYAYVKVAENGNALLVEIE